MDRPEQAKRDLATRTLDDDEAAVGRRFATPEVGQRIGRYEVIERLGAGGMGTVYSARDPRLERQVAIKLIRPERAGSEQARARFVREARAMAKIAHPNVVEVYDSGVSEGRPYVVMELVVGTTLDGWVNAASRTTEEVLERVVAAGRGLIAAHEAGLIHRDFKPANVLIGDDGRVRVSDFGLARALEEPVPEPSAEIEITRPEELDSLTRTGAVLGSPVYMAPEQHQGDLDVTVDARADQFAFAITLVEALTGRRPYEASSAIALLGAKLDGPPTLPQDSAWLREFGPHVRRALQPLPRDRWPTVTAFLSALSPRARGRRNLAYGGLALAVGLAGFALVPGADSRCRVGRERMQAVWGPVQRGMVGGVMNASGRDHASETATRVVTHLDERTAAWTAVYVASCQSGGERLDTTMACLEEQRTRLDRAVTTLTTADAATTDRALAIASAGAMPGRCLEPEDDALGGVPPERQALAKEIRAEVHHAKRREHLGHGEEADSLTERALQRARDFGHPPLLAFALTTRASALESVGRYDEAMAFIEEAIEVAGHADAWKQSAAAQIEGVFLEGYRRGNTESALRLGRLAEAALARAGGDAQLQASLLSNLGATYHRMGDVEAACSAMAESLMIREANPRAYSSPIAHKLAVVAARENVGACMITAGQYAEALPFLESALEASRSVFGANNPELAGLHQALSSALESNGRYTEALEHIDHCLALWTKSLPPGDARIAGALADRGYALSAAGRLTEAADTMLKAADMMEAARGTEDAAPWAYRANAVEALVAAGELERAAPLAETALRRVLALSEPGDNERSVAYTAAGRVAMERGKPAAALAHFRGALADAELRWGADHLGNVPPQIDIGKALRAMGDQAGATAAFERAVSLAAIEPHREPIHTGEAYFELAKAVRQADPDRARELAEQSVEIYGRHAEMPDRVEEVQTWLAMGGHEAPHAASPR
ncbi:MAG: tetratricopeptide repeat protein [Myxococcota bacterium]